MYVYATLEFYDKENGIRGGGGLGVLAADTRRIAERLGLPLVVVTPFYPKEVRQRYVDGRIVDEVSDVNWRDFGYSKLDTVEIKCNNDNCRLDVISKGFGKTQILAITEPGFGALYQGESGSEHRLYQEVALGFGGFKALRKAGVSLAVLQLNEVVTVFMAVALLDALVMAGEKFGTALEIVRQRTIYTNHTLVQAAEASFTHDQFERYVYTNIQSPRVRELLDKFFIKDKIRLSNLAFELSARRNGVSKLHAAVANYKDIEGRKVYFKAITNGIDLKKWVLPEILNEYQTLGVLDEKLGLTTTYAKGLNNLTALDIRNLKRRGREVMNEILSEYPNQNGKVLRFDSDERIFVFKRRFVDYKRPEMPFTDVAKLRAALEPHGAHYIIAGRVHAGDSVMAEKLRWILEVVGTDDYLRDHVHYLADYDERLAYGLSVGCNIAINIPKVGLEACGTSWMKDVANLNFLVSTHDGGVADVQSKYYFPVHGENYEAERDSLYYWMENALKCWEKDFDLEFRMGMQLYGMLPVISGERMMREYLDFVRRV